MLYQDFFITNSFTGGNVFFLYRQISSNNYKEIKLQIEGKTVFGMSNLFRHEVEYLKKCVLPERFQKIY